MVGLKIGDIITAYHAGFHQIIKIEERKDNTPIIHYKQILTADGKKKNLQKERSCDESFCMRATNSIAEQINNLFETQETILVLQQEMNQAKRKDN